MVKEELSEGLVFEISLEGSERTRHEFWGKNALRENSVYSGPEEGMYLTYLRNQQGGQGGWKGLS